MLSVVRVENHGDTFIKTLAVLHWLYSRKPADFKPYSKKGRDTGIPFSTSARSSRRKANRLVF